MFSFFRHLHDTVAAVWAQAESTAAARLHVTVLDPLQQHGGCGAASVANGRAAVLSHLERVQQRDKDPAARAAQSVS